MNSNHWQTGEMEVVYLFSWPLMLFTRGRLPLGQQYCPLNRKPKSGFRFLISTEFRAEKRSAQFFCGYAFAGASELKTLPFDSVVVVEQWLLW